MKLRILIILLFVGSAAAGQVVSDFSAGIDGWTTTDQDGVPTYNAAGYLTGNDWGINVGAGTIPVYWTFNAPAKFTGNKLAYYNGTLSFDLQQTTTRPWVAQQDIVLNAGTVSISYSNIVPNYPATFPAWTTYNIPLTELSGKWLNNATGAIATASDFQFVMGNLISMTIRGRYGLASSTGSIDNVRLTQFLVGTQPVTPTTVCAGTAVSLTTAASGNPAITYQWQRLVVTAWTDLTNTAVYSNVATATLGINTTTGGAGTYRARISGLSANDILSNQAVVNVNPLPAAPGSAPSAACPGVTQTLTATGGTAGSYRWFTVASGGTAIAGQTAATFTTPVLAATTTYYAAVTNGTCTSNRTAITATVVPNPAPGASGAARCGTGTVTLNATGGSAGQYRWYTVVSGGTAIAGQTNAAFTTPTITGTTTYYAAIDNGFCESPRTAAVATVNTLPPTPVTTGASGCVASSVVLSATGGTAGQYRWYTVASGGTAIAGQTAATYTTPILLLTTTFYVSLNNGTCEGARAPVTATISLVPSAPGATGGSSCSAPSAIVLTATGASAGQYRWYTAASGGTAIAGQTNGTFTTPSINATTTYYVSIVSGICESTRTSVVAQINTPPAAPTVTDGNGCGPSSVTLTAFGGAAGQYRWYTVASGGSTIAGQTAATYSTPVLNATTIFYVAINNIACESARTAVTANIIDPPVTPTVTGATGCTSSPAPLTLHASGSTDGNYRWYTAASGGSAIGGEVSSAYTTPVLSVTTSFYVSAVNGLCESSRAEVVASVINCDKPPVIDPRSSTAQIDGVVTVDLIDLISDPDDDIDLNSLKIYLPPYSGAIASINGDHQLVVNYKGVAFSGVDSLMVEVCDQAGLCSQQTIFIEVVGDLNVYDGISPNGDNKNDTFIIQYIESLEATRKNHVSIFNRWGDLVFEIDDYDNNTHIFKGLGTAGEELPGGTYYYKIVFTSGKKTVTGFLSLKR